MASPEEFLRRYGELDNDVFQAFVPALILCEGYLAAKGSDLVEWNTGEFTIEATIECNSANGWFSIALSSVSEYESSLRNGELPQFLTDLKHGSFEAQKLAEIIETDKTGTVAALTKRNEGASNLSPYNVALQYVGDFFSHLFGYQESTFDPTIDEKVVGNGLLGLRLLALVHL